MLKGKHVLLGVTGSIAAYKAALLVRLLVKEGAEVRVLMTEMAKQFITPLTMATLSKNPILVEFYNPENGDWNSHVSLGLWADVYLIAPASANTIAKMATGVADNLLLTTYLSAKCPVIVAPAMDLDMYRHEATTENLSVLRRRGVGIVEAASGELASGLEGKGRMEEPERIVGFLRDFFRTDERLTLQGKNVLLTAGPTVEPIDPVRYISNHSSGKMGYALAEELSARGANVHLVSGPVHIGSSGRNIVCHKVQTCEQMYSKCMEIYSSEKVDIVVLCAAVADYTPVTVSDSKIKRKGDNLSIELKPNKDIAAELGKVKKPYTLSVGFALETDNEKTNAEDKLRRKNLDMIVLNSLKDSGAGFAGDTNKVTIFFKNGQEVAYPLKSKTQVAADIVDNIERIMPECSKA